MTTSFSTTLFQKNSKIIWIELEFQFQFMIVYMNEIFKKVNWIFKKNELKIIRLWQMFYWKLMQIIPPKKSSAIKSFATILQCFNTVPGDNHGYVWKIIENNINFNCSHINRSNPMAAFFFICLSRLDICITIGVCVHHINSMVKYYKLDFSLFNPHIHNTYIQILLRRIQSTASKWKTRIGSLIILNQHRQSTNAVVQERSMAVFNRNILENNLLPDLCSTNLKISSVSALVRVH